MKYDILTLGLSDDMYAFFKLRFGIEEIGLDMAFGIRDAVRLFSSRVYHMVIADVGHLKITCRDDLLAGMRRTSFIPIVVLTDQYSESEAKRLTDLGVDLCQPNNEAFGTLFSLIMALFRRSTAYNYDYQPLDIRSSLFRCGDISIDSSRRKVIVRGRSVELRPREFSLLLYFMRNPQRVLTADHICEYAWGMEYTQSVGQAIYDLRKKIERDPAQPAYIETIHRIGYRFISNYDETCGRNETIRKE